MEWHLRGNALSTPRRSGGIVAAKGAEYQIQYACWILSQLVTGESGLLVLRYEGAQDLDIISVDNRQTHVQVKRYESTPFSWSHLEEILKGFFEDQKDARPANGVVPLDGLRFRAVIFGAVAHNGVLDIIRGVRLAKHARTLAGAAVSPAKSSAADIRLMKSILERTIIEVFPVSSPSEMFRLMADAKLIRFGVKPQHLDDATARLIANIRWREDLRAGDVANWLGEFVEPHHPASPASPFMFVPGIKAGSPRNEAFYLGRATIWPAVINDADVRRNDVGRLLEAMRSGSTSKVMLRGPSGAGKSTLVRRAAWELQQHGEAIVLDLQDPTANVERAWNECERLARLQQTSGRSIWLILDDLPDYPDLVERVAALPQDSPLKIVATSWRTKLNPVSFGAGYAEVTLGAISREEAEQAASKLNGSLNDILSDELDQVLRSGQFLVLNLLLMGRGSVDDFARGLLVRLTEEEPDLRAPYLDLCVCGGFDLWVPLSLLTRRNPQAPRLLHASGAAGLVFPNGRRANLFRSGHRILSDAVTKVAELELVDRMLSLVESVDRRNEAERRLAVRLLDLASRDEFRAITETYHDRVRAQAERLAIDAEYLDLKRLAISAHRCGLLETENSLLAMANADRVRTPLDASQFRIDWGRREPGTVFRVLLNFYERTQAEFGWKNFLRFCMNVDNMAFRREALDHARERVTASSIDGSTAKVVVDLVSRLPQPPDYAEQLIIDLLQRFPGDPDLARSVGYAAYVRIQTPRLANAIAAYTISLMGVGDVRVVKASKMVTRAVFAAPPKVKSDFYKALVDLASSLIGLERAQLLHSAAEIAQAADYEELLPMIGPERAGEESALHNARRIVTIRSRTT